MKKSILLLAVFFLSACSDGFNAKDLGSTGGGQGSEQPPVTQPPDPTPGDPCGNALLSWVNPTTNTDGSPITEPLSRNIIRYGTQMGVYSTEVILSNPPATVTNFNIPNLQLGLTYYFVVRAVNQQNQQSDDSNAVMKTISQCAPAVVPETRPEGLMYTIRELEEPVDADGIPLFFNVKEADFSYVSMPQLFLESQP